ncbi:hypothetical protein RJ639_005970 [Escallonia herrerae]|uniref:dCTP pyrophosphatase 1 n=1 Tax=Escallonia herrerae TaxID=1293975 RepID=A0AA88W0E0_9ASTE|nr:hypothetical protein RJ639_005970 [Escallonia herrerae]
MGGEEIAEDKVVDIGLKDLSKKLEEFAKARDWEKYHSPRNLLLAMITINSACSIVRTFHVSIAISILDFCFLLLHLDHNYLTVALHEVGEVGELSEIFQWRGEVDRGLPNWEESDKEHLGEELSDVLLYLIRLADMCDIDLGQAATKKIGKNAIKYPPKAF